MSDRSRPWVRPTPHQHRSPYELFIDDRVVHVPHSAVRNIANAAGDESTVEESEVESDEPLRDRLHEEIEPGHVVNLLPTLVEELRAAGWLIVLPPGPLRRDAF